MSIFHVRIYNTLRDISHHIASWSGRAGSTFYPKLLRTFSRILCVVDNSDIYMQKELLLRSARTYSAPSLRFAHNYTYIHKLKLNSILRYIYILYMYQCINVSILLSSAEHRYTYTYIHIYIIDIHTYFYLE